MSLLKEAISEFDTSDNLEVKGPMLDPILSWDGDGELPIYKDAASILERYYFNEKNDKGVNVVDEGSELEAKYQNDKGSASGKSMENAKGTGTEQAGTSDAGTILASKAEKEKDIAKEDVQLEDETVEEKELNDKEVPKNKEYTDEAEELDMENAIIEKLISEMEDEDEDEDDSDDDDDKEEVEEAEVMSYTGDDVKPGMQAKDEKKASGPEEDTHGAGTEQAGTGPDEGEIPPRKDVHDKMVKPKNYTDENAMIEAALAELESEISEQDDAPPAPDGDEGGDDEDKDLDVDKEMTKEQAASAVPGGPGPKDKGEDKEDDESYYAEAFELFKEAIQDDDEVVLDEAWMEAVDKDAEHLISLGETVNLDEAFTDREKTFLFGYAQRMFGQCAKKCGRIAVRSQANACKDNCIAKRDAAIKAARAKAKAAKAKAKGKDAKAAKYADKAKQIKSY